MNPKRPYFAGEDILTYTELDLDRGVGMVFHPVSGSPLRRLCYNRLLRQFQCSFHYGGWSLKPDTVLYDKISAGSPWKVGNPFPGHWLFHPLTGKKL